MKRLIVSCIGVLFLFVSIQSFSQAKSQEVLYADKYYQVEDYFLAAEYYMKAYEKDKSDLYAAYQYAQCERLFFNYDQAEKFYKIVKDQDPENYPLALYYYALMLKTNGRYLPAEASFEEFIGVYSGDDESLIGLASLHYNGCVVALEALKKPQREYHFRNVGAPVNSAESDFSPSIYKHDSSIVIASARQTGKKEEIYGKLGGAYLNKYHFENREEGWLDITNEGEDDFDKVNTEHHDGAGIFNSEKTKFYFTRCDLEGKSEGDKECGIYVIRHDRTSWSEPELLNENINMPKEYNAQPTLTLNNDTMFFVSKRPGGFGENDLWVSVKTGEEDWGVATNLGEKINTARHEMSPNYYSDENILFFSSDGHESMGGLDIFIAKGTHYDRLRNIGLPFNSNKDDFYFALGEGKGYLSSNRDGGLGHDDIYSFDVVSYETLIAEIWADTTGANTITIRGVIHNDDGTPAEGVVVILTDTEGNEIRRTTTNEEGEFVFAKLDPTIDYRIILEEDDGSLTTEILFSIDNIEVEGDYSVPVVEAELISISGIILDENNVAQVMEEVVLTDHEGNELQTTYTDEKGSFIFANLDPSIDYQVMLRDKETGELKKVDLNDGIIVLGTEKVLNTTSLQAAATGVPSRVLFENIYFDFDKSHLRKEAKEVLDDLVNYAKSNPDLKIELNGHTDGLGGDAYNKVLGKKRGKTAYDYLVKKGISKSQIVVNSLGESNPLASNSHPVGRQLNRRVEFYIVGGGEYDAPAKIYVLTPNTSMNDVATKFNMSPSELEALNGGAIDVSQAYVPVRVSRRGSEGIVPDELLQIQFTEYVVKGGGVPSEASYNKDVVYNEYDNSGYYVVLPKNTLYSIAKICGTSIEKIMELNGLTSTHIFPGQKLQVSGSTKVSKGDYDNTTSFADAGLSVKDNPGQVIQVGDGLRYVVKNGDSFYSVCKKFGMQFEELRTLNNMSDYLLMDGMVLLVKELTEDELESNSKLEAILSKYNTPASDLVDMGNREEVLENIMKGEGVKLKATPVVEEDNSNETEAPTEE